MTKVDVTNVLSVSPIDLSLWLISDILSIRIPEYGPHNTINVYADVEPLLPQVANRLSLATELYVLVVAAKPIASEVKGSPDNKTMAEYSRQKIDALYRCIQTLESQRETISRMITSASRNMQSSKFNGGI